MDINLLNNNCLNKEIDIGTLYKYKHNKNNKPKNYYN